MSRTKKGKHNSEAPSTKKDFIDALKSWQIHLICLLILMIAPMILHSPIITDGKVITSGDIIQWRAGAESLMNYQEQSGEQAQWSTNMFSGMPAYVISNLERFPSFDTIILPLFKFIFPLTEYWILLGGAYFFLLVMGYRPLISVVGALIIGLTAYIPIIIGAGHNTKFFAYAYIPWVFAGYKLMSDRMKSDFTENGFKYGGFLMFLAAFMLHVRAGHPQVTYYFLFLLAIWWIFDGIQARKSGKIKVWAQHTAFLIAAGLLAVFSVVEQNWALLEYSSASIRGGSDIAGNTGLDQGYAFIWSQGWGELLTLIIPGLYGGTELYWGPKLFTGGPHYFGAIAFFLMVIGLVFNRRAHSKIFIIAGSLAVLFSLGKHFGLLNNLMFDYFPLFNKFRTPEMWLMLAVFSFTVPAMDGLSWFADRSAQVVSSGKKWLIVAGIVLLPGIFVLVAADSLFSFEKDGERAQIAQQVAQSNQVSPEDPRVAQAVDRIFAEQLLPERVAMAKADALKMVIVVGLAVGLLFIMVSGKLAISIALIGIVGLTMFDMVSVGKTYVADYSYQDAGFDAERVIESRKRPVDTWLQSAILTDEPWTYRVFPLAENAFNNAVPSYFYPSIGGYSGAKMGIYNDVIDEALFGGQTGINRNILSLLNVKYITYGSRIPGFDVAHESDGLLVLENPVVLPKAFFVDSLVYAGSASEAMEFIKDPSVDLGKTAIVMGEDGIATGVDSLASVEVTRYDAHQIDLKVSRSSDGFLVLGEIYYQDGWKAELNGESIPIYRTNYLVRGIVVPAGDHQITMVYQPDWYKPVRFISTAANMVILVLIVGLLVMYYRPKVS
ncbi:MAG TPA: hypothetical protein DCE78_02205 [Bacteroidetes bacterium]|nr:hypothetical protein [Bacteroidota bacterium]